jgi:hypothetical protein
MTAPCIPPADTPAMTTCWLYYDPPDGKPRQWVALIWLPPDCWGAVYDMAVNRATRFGWRFHSVAVVPRATGIDGA